MALVRILVDGYSLLHGWPELAPGKPRHSAAARDELVRVLTRHGDAVGTPITVFFDGAGRTGGPPVAESTPDLEILYSRSGQTADQMIERAVHRFAPYGEVLVVTDDRAERDTVMALGGLASDCRNFIQAAASTHEESEREIKHHNRRERARFARVR